MDLQLGLSVSRGFDLNSSINIETEEIQTQKRRFHEAFEDEQAADAGAGAGVPRTLALLVWEKENRAAGDLDDEADSSSVLTNKRSTDHVDDRCVVGWPPVSATRKKICQQNRQSGRFVKVKMEGVGIARKVDINLHLSPQPLLRTLLAMFGKCQESAQFYQLKYQDGEGDWQLVVDDVNWGNFRRSVQRLEVVKKQ